MYSIEYEYAIAKQLDYWPCKALERNNDTEDQTFTVRIFQSPIFSKTKWTVEGSFRFVTNLPRQSIKFVTRPYKDAMHAHGVFRQEITIHDDIFPQSWMNLK